MSAAEEELIPEQEAAQYLEVTPQRLREFASQGALQSVIVQGPSGHEVMYYRGEVLALKERLRGKRTADTEEWPDVIDE